MVVAIGNPNLVYLGYGPKDGSKAVRVDLTFASGAAIDFDLLNQGEEQRFTTCQAVYIDNSLNADVFKLICQGTQMPIYCPSQSVGMFPIAALGKLAFTASFLTLNAATLSLWLLSVPQPYFVYPVL